MSGAFLALNGYRVGILEKHHQIGGNLQTFTRKGVKFNSAMHFVGAMDPGQILHQVFSYLGIRDKTGLAKLNPEAYEEIYIGDRHYAHANGMEAYGERLLSYFPGEKEAISAYLKKIKDVWNSTNVLNLQDFRNHIDADTQYTLENAHKFIDRLTGDRDMKALLGVSSALYAGVPDKSPLLTHAIINYHYIQSAYKFSGGSDLMAGALEGVIRDHGGRIHRNCEVTGFKYEDREICSALTGEGGEVSAKSFISNIHPANTVKLVEPGRFRKAYVNRITELENTIGSYCVYIRFKKRKFRNIDANVFISLTREVWSAGLYDKLPWPSACILYTSPDPEDKTYAESMVASAFMKMDELEAWKDSRVEKRGEEYKDFKAAKAEKLIDMVSSRFPDVRAGMEDYYTATPLTFRDYTGIPEGSVYGILKDCNNPRRSYISPYTRIPNLFLTGQNSGVGLHGVLGVTVSSLFTCSNFLDIGELLDNIRND